MFVIAGVTGNTGSVVAETLLAAGRMVRVLVRDAAKGAPWRERGADVRVLASLDDETELTSALEGAHGAYLLSPPGARASDFLAVRRKTFEAIAGAIDRSHIPHVVLLSSIGAQHQTGTGPIRTLHDAEQRLAKTSAKLTFVRASYFLENWAAVAAATKEGNLPTFIRADLTIPMVATRDIGIVAAKALLEGPPASKIDIIELAGSRDLSAEDVAKIFGKLVGRTVTAREAPLDAIVPTFMSFGISENVASLYREMYEGVTNGKVAWESKNARLVRGTVDPENVLRAFV
ncbi:MAG TPA: NmrA family NAD(P)-binding protein [Labilithrix sp.]|nr:NmrA family NAD(P)-binding protein [Labilithrix sp.]